MKALVRYIILNPIVVKLVLLFAFIFGLVGLQNMNSNFFTPIEPNFMRISVAYPGASALEVEDGILIKIENNLKRIPGIEQVNSTAQENIGNVLIEFQKGVDTDDVVENVKNAVNQVNNFPQGAEKPVIYKEPSIDPAATLSIVGDLPLIKLKDLALMVQQDLTNLDGISLVKLVGLPQEEIQIQISQKTLQAFNLTLADVGQAILNQNIDLTAGSIESDTQTFVVRNRQKDSSIDKVKSIVIKASDNHLIRLGDIADIKFGWSDNGELNFYNQQRSISIKVDKTIDEDLLGMIDSINDYVTQFNKRQTGSMLLVTADRSNILKQRIGLLTKNGVVGFFLIMLCLSIFLSFRLSFWVAFSIPISFLGLFFFGSLIGITINVISLFGMIVVIGILVDDGIIIAENIYQHVERGEKPLDAAIKGVAEVTPSILAAITTTIIAFSPFFFLDGMSSKIMSDIAVVVIITLLVSLIEGLFMLPAHLVQSNGLKLSKPNPLKKRFEKGISYVKDVLFRQTLVWSLNHRAIVFTAVVIALIGTFAALKNGIIQTTFFPYIDSDQTKIDVTMPAGTRQAETLRILTSMEPAIAEINNQFKANRSDGKDIVLSVTKTVQSNGAKGSLTVELLDGETRKTESSEITAALRKQIGTIEGVESINFGVRGFFGKPVVIALKGNDLIALEQAKADLKKQLIAYSKIKDIVDASALGSPELLVEFSDNISMLGLTPALIMNQIRNGFYGLDIQDVQRGINEVSIRAEFAAVEKDSLARLDQLLIKTNDNQYIPLGSIATYKIVQGNQKITRTNGVRQVNLEANLANAKDPVPQILADIKQTIVEPTLKNYPTIQYEFLGQSREQEKMRKSMPKVMNITMIVMFATIAAGFGSFYQAFLVLLIIPFGFIGVAWGHKLHGMPLSIMSTYGIIALIGIIVNDSIVLTNTYNRLLVKGINLKKAIIEASVARFRPIILTSITTIAGLGPLILEQSRQAQFLIPMAIAICYGLLVATFFILILLPIFIFSFNQIRYVVKSKLFKQTCTPESIEPAMKKMEFQNEMS